jgi:hypothetical protein
MNNVIVRDQSGVEAYRKRLFKSKEKCRRIFAQESFDKKIEIAFELYRQAEYLKKFKAARPRNRAQGS